MKVKISLLITLISVIVPLSSVCGQTSFVSGGASTGNEVNVSFSIGQPVIGYASDGNSSINIGVQQVYEEIISTAADFQYSDISLSVYPNPFVDMIEVQVSDPNPAYNVLIFDTKGALVYSFSLTTSPLSLNLSALPDGVYHLALTDKQLKLLGNVKIVKHL